MKKIIYISILVITFGFNQTTSYAETKLDCSQYTNKTFTGTLAKRRCLKGLPPKEKVSISDKIKKLNPFKKKNNIKIK